jgi:molybdenum-dependent DNA-binding transcriptional regulator ModE
MQSEHITEWLTIREAGTLLRLGANAVRILVDQGIPKCRGVKIETASVERYVKLRRRGDDAGYRLNEIRSAVVEEVRPSEEAMAEFRDIPAEEWPEEAELPEEPPELKGHQKFRVMRQQAFLEAFKRCGSVMGATRAAGLSARRHYTWLDNDPQYKLQFDDVCTQTAAILTKRAAMRAEVIAAN